MARTKRVYFSTGEIIEYTGGNAALKRIIAVHQRWPIMETEPCRYWFRPTDAWREASNKSLERWRKTHRTPWSNHPWIKEAAR